MNKPIPKVNLHPSSCKYLKLGHPWITDDSYTKKFPKAAQFLIGVDEKDKKEIALLINDPQHKTVKARLWSLDAADFNNEFNFLQSLQTRLSAAMKKRVDSGLYSERENFYLVNGESDQLPGLLIQMLKNEVIIQYYAFYWKALESELITAIKGSLKEHYPEIGITDYWIQERTFDQKNSMRSLSRKESSEFELQEFGRNYKIRINQHYDFGIYSDMSAIRKTMTPFLKDKKSLLNLFSYTGAFSVFALGLGHTNVVSVDLSSKYLAWLEENIALNPEIDAANNHNLCMPCEKALDKLIAEKLMFDVIICDPPSASSDGQKVTAALKSYETLLPKMLKLLHQQGSLFVFLNTHTISWNKFEEKLKQIISETPEGSKLQIGKRFKLAEDCAPLKGFHEGDYLKGFLIDYKNKGMS